MRRIAMTAIAFSLAMCFSFAATPALAGSMETYVTLPAGETIEIITQGSDTILDVKGKIHAITGIPVALQQLMFAGKILEEDSFTLADYNIQKQSTLTLLPFEGWPPSPDALANTGFDSGPLGLGIGLAALGVSLVRFRLALLKVSPTR